MSRAPSDLRNREHLINCAKAMNRGSQENDYSDRHTACFGAPELARPPAEKPLEPEAPRGKAPHNPGIFCALKAS
jgi:hypothetical protein